MKTILAQSLLVCSLASAPVAFLVFSFDNVQAASGSPQFGASGCISCHSDLESIREEGSNMGRALAMMGRQHGDTEGCTLCHSGNPQATTIDVAHRGLIVDPGENSVADSTCGQCHPNYAYRVKRGFMSNAWGKVLGKGAVTSDPDGDQQLVGTDEYKEYMQGVPSAPLAEKEHAPGEAPEIYAGMSCSDCHMVGHRLHSSRRAGNGIPEATCNTCHAAFQRECAADDAHTKSKMLCQDCHTTIDVHGDGNLFASKSAQVEIECADCHGTAESLPWQLPLGFSDEFEKKFGASVARGLAEVALPVTRGFATIYDSEDGLLLSARGNPLANVVKKGDKVVLHSANGEDIEVPLLINSNKE